LFTEDETNGEGGSGVRGDKDHHAADGKNEEEKL